MKLKNIIVLVLGTLLAVRAPTVIGRQFPELAEGLDSGWFVRAATGGCARGSEDNAENPTGGQAKKRPPYSRRT